MGKHDRICTRYLKNPLPVRLAGLAPTLRKVASSARRESGADAGADLHEEGQYFIEWTAGEAEPEITGAPEDIQVMLSLWHRARQEARTSPRQRIMFSVQAKM